jgi:hypothetical protein
VAKVFFVLSGLADLGLAAGFILNRRAKVSRGMAIA